MGNGRKQIEIKPISDMSRRRVTLTKRRKGLFKKLDKLRTLTGCKGVAIAFTTSGLPFISGDLELLKRFETGSGEGGENLGGSEPEVSEGGEALKRLEAEMNMWMDMRRRLIEAKFSDGGGAVGGSGECGENLGGSELGFLPEVSEGGEDLNLPEMEMNMVMEMRRKLIQAKFADGRGSVGELVPPSRTVDPAPTLMDSPPRLLTNFAESPWASFPEPTLMDSLPRPLIDFAESPLTSFPAPTLMDSPPWQLMDFAEPPSISFPAPTLMDSPPWPLMDFAESPSTSFSESTLIDSPPWQLMDFAEPPSMSFLAPLSFPSPPMMSDFQESSFMDFPAIVTQYSNWVSCPSMCMC